MAHVYAWGYRYYKQIGVEDSEIPFEQKIQPHCSPALVTLSRVEPPGNIVVQVEATAQASFARTSEGEVFSWGTLYEEIVAVPRALQFSRARINRLSCGTKHVLALDADGNIYSWGCGLYGRLGHGNEVSVTKPRMISVVQNTIDNGENDMIADVAAGSAHSAVLTSFGRVWLWGFNRFCQVGHPNAAQHVYSPRRLGLPQFEKDEYVSSVILGRGHSAILSTHGKLYTWGATSFGRLGFRSSSRLIAYPKLVKKLEGSVVQQYACGDFHSIAILGDGAVVTWGRGDGGQLGHGTFFHSSTPRPVEALAGLRAASVFAGPLSSAVITSHGEILVWGRCNGGAGAVRCDESEVHIHPFLLQTLGGDVAGCVMDAACGGAHMLALVTSFEDAQGTVEVAGKVEFLEEAKGVGGEDEDTSATESEDAIEALISGETKVETTYYPPSSADTQRPKTASPRTEQAFSFCRHNRITEVVEILNEGFDVDRRDANGNTLLLISAQNNLKRIARTLIKRGADIDAANHKGNTSLHYAFKYGFLELFDYLVGEGADQTLLNNQGLACYDEGFDGDGEEESGYYM